MAPGTLTNTRKLPEAAGAGRNVGFSVIRSPAMIRTVWRKGCRLASLGRTSIWCSPSVSPSITVGVDPRGVPST